MSIYYSTVESILRNVVELIESQTISNTHLSRFKYYLNPDTNNITIKFSIIDIMPVFVKDHYYYTDVEVAVNTIGNLNLRYNRQDLMMEYVISVDNKQLNVDTA